MTHALNSRFHNVVLLGDFSFRVTDGTGGLDGIGGLTDAGKKVPRTAGHGISLLVRTRHERFSKTSVIWSRLIALRATQGWMQTGQAAAYY
jgi:hypothetical protein